jgi:hypothetical protein
LLAVPTAPQWTKENADHLRTFLLNPTGQALLTRARARQASLCIEACDGLHDVKVASGFGFAINWFENLAKISGESPVQDSNDEPAHAQEQDVDTQMSYS